MTKRELKQAKVGDSVKFSVTTRGGRQTATRKIVANDNGILYVRFNGWPKFELGVFPGDKIHWVIESPRTLTD